MGGNCKKSGASLLLGCNRSFTSSSSSSSSPTLVAHSKSFASNSHHLQRQVETTKRGSEQVHTCSKANHRVYTGRNTNTATLIVPANTHNSATISYTLISFNRCGKRLGITWVKSYTRLHTGTYYSHVTAIIVLMV